MGHNKDTEINQHSFGHLTFDKCMKNIHWKRQSFQHVIPENWISICKKMETDLYLSLNKKSSQSKSLP